MEWINENKHWIFSGIGVLLLTITYQLIKIFISKVKIKRKNKFLNGIWISTFLYDKNHDNQFKEYTEIIKLSTVGSRVIGNVVEDSRNYTELKEFAHKNPIRIEGELFDKRLFSGKWFHPINQSNFFGVFQLIISFNGDKMEGRWIGFRESSNEIDQGIWKWEKEKRNTHDKT